jgi:PAS domain S-box-containing protein
MDGVSRHLRVRSARASGVPLLALIVLLGIGGFVLTSTTIRHDRDRAAQRRAEVQAVQAQEVLGRARAYVAGLAEVLARESQPGQARFARWAEATSASVGLNDVLWVQSVPASGRRRYERLRGVPITRLTPSGRVSRAPAARAYLPATFTSQTRPELRPGVDVTNFPALAAAIRDRATIFAVGASRPGALGQEPGFYLLQAASFSRGRDSRGYLIAFVPRGWFSTTLGGDPRNVAITSDGRRVEGQLRSIRASAGFEMLGRDWRINVSREPLSGLQSMLPWLALFWPFAVAAIVFAIGRAIALRRRAQREVERIFELSLDLICVAGLDGRFKAVNPAFEQTLGYPQAEMLSQPFVQFVHPDDQQRSREVFADVVGGDEVNQFENRYICADGSARWLQWSARAVPQQGVVYATARDVTDRRRIDAELREAKLTAEARGDELQVLADEQAALRRVATLVVSGVPAAEVFSAVAEELKRLFDAEGTAIARLEPDNTITIVAITGSGRNLIPVGSRVKLQPGMVLGEVIRTGRAARVDDYRREPEVVRGLAQRMGVRCTVAVPIMVEGSLWGAIGAGTDREHFPADTQQRLGEFTELVGTAISNIQARSDLAASRARIVAAADEERRRVVRDLHDGAQQRLVHTIVTLQLAHRALRNDEQSQFPALLTEALDNAEQAKVELRELAHGILPAVLTQGGLRAGVDALASRTPVPVQNAVTVGRLPSAVEATAYFVVAEALTNVAKHAHARRATVTARVEDSTVRLQVRDDGIGGARPYGSGLLGLADRLAAHDGQLRVESPADGGTLVAADIPLTG